MSEKRFHPAFATFIFALAFVCLWDTMPVRGAGIPAYKNSDIRSADPCSLVDTLIADGWDLCKISVRMASAPFHAKGKEWLVAVGLITTVALSSTVDRPLRERIRKSDCPWCETVTDAGRFYQSEYVTLAVAAALYSYGWWKDKPAVRRIGVEVLEAFALSGAGSGLLKHLVGRDRPYVERGPYHFVGPNCQDEHQSFLSGDATKAFALTSVLSAEAKSIPVTILLYSLATATALQRLRTDQHWFSDTIGSAVWGSAVGFGVVYLNHRRNPESGKPSSGHQPINITFTNLANSAPGIAVSFGL